MQEELVEFAARSEMYISPSRPLRIWGVLSEHHRLGRVTSSPRDFAIQAEEELGH